MKANDLKLNKDEIRTQMQKAIKENDTDGFYEALDQMVACIAQDLADQYEQQIEQMRRDGDGETMAQRGVRTLTSQETEYYTQLAEALRSKNPKQALSGLSVVMPETVLETVFEELRTNHPLLSKINFINTNGAVKMLVNTNGYQEAQWGKLTDEIIKEVSSGFAEVNTGLAKLSAFVYVSKSMLDLGPRWLDRFVREVLYEALANGLEKGIVDGTGNDEPIGMTRQVGEGVTVTGGVYPKKTAIAVNDLSVQTFGNLLSYLAISPKGKLRTVNDLILLVNPVDYYKKIMPATTAMTPDGGYRNNILPYPAQIIPTNALDEGSAVLGIAKRYFAPAGMEKEGQIEYSDHYRMLEDDRTYIIKLYANGMPLDNNAFLLLDISGLTPIHYKVEVVDSREKSDDATLSSLKIGNLTLSPAFDAGTLTYTAATTGASAKITAVPADAGAGVAITVGTDGVENGGQATWETGANTVRVVVIAEDGETTQIYTVTVTKS